MKFVVLNHDSGEVATYSLRLVGPACLTTARDKAGALKDAIGGRLATLARPRFPFRIIRKQDVAWDLPTYSHEEWDDAPL